MSKSIRKALEQKIEWNKKCWKDVYHQLDNYKTFKSIKLPLETELSSSLDNHDQIHVKIFHETVLDTLMAALSYGFKPLILNIVNEHNPIDILKQGGVGEEYDVLRKTNYYNTIDESFYPIGRTDLIYSEKIFLIKDATDKTIKNPQIFSMISMPISKSPKLIYNKSDGKNQTVYSDEQEEIQMKQKVNSIFAIAAKYNHNCIIMNDLKCGNDGHPAYKVVEFLNANIARGFVQYVFFAIKNHEKIPRDTTFNYFFKNIQRIQSAKLDNILREDSIEQTDSLDE